MTTVGGKDAPKVDKSWVPFAQIALEWLHPKRDLDPTPWVEEVVERSQAMGINTLAFDFAHGGYAVFNGAVAQKDGHIGDADIIALLDEVTHRRNMRLVLMNMGAHCNSYASNEYEAWRVRDSNNQPLPGLLSFWMCLNTPYAGFLLQEIRGLITRYNVDGLYIEGLYGTPCYCHYCRTEFRQIYGYEIPTDKELAETNRDCRQFRASVATDFIRRVRELTDSVSPKTAFVPCPSFFENGYADFSAWSANVDGICLERQWGFERFSIPLFEIGLSMQVVRAESHRPPYGTLWLGWGVDRNYAPCPSPHYRLNFAELLLYGGTPQLHSQTIFELDETEIPTVREMYEFEGKARPFLVDAELVADVALVLDYENFEISEHFKGFYQSLVEAHIPFTVLAKRDLEIVDLANYKAVLLPNVVRLSDRALEQLTRYSAGGGGLVLTFRTGWENDKGERRDSWPLYGLAGVAGPHGIITNPSSMEAKDVRNYGHFMNWPVEQFQVLPQNYYKVIDGAEIDGHEAGRLQSFAGAFVEVTAADCQVQAEVLDYDYSKMHKHHPVLGWYPGDAIAPLVVSREGAGRTILVAGELDRAAYRAGFPGLLQALADSARWAAGGELRLSTDAPITVEMATHFSASKNSYTTILVNQTTNQLHHSWVVREVLRVPSLQFEIRVDGAVKGVSSIRGNDISWEQGDGVCKVTLGGLEEVDAVVIEVGTA